MRPSLLVAAVALALAGCSSAKPVSGNDAGAACTVDGRTFPAGTFNPNQPCQTCQPAISASVFSTFTGLPPSGGCATSQQVCNAGTCQSGCVIPDLGFEPAGALEAGNACRVCDPSRWTTAWSSLTGAPLDGGCPGANLCLNGQCVSGCLIDGGLIATGTADPTNGCEICQPGTLATGYSPVNDATPCQTNGNYCKAGACIFGCYVGGKLFDAGDSSPTNVCDVCAASTVGQPVMAFSPTTVTTQCNENGGTYCAQGACIPVCLIGATFYDAGAPDPTDPDQCCNPATPGAWTPGFASAITTPSTTGTPAAVAIGDVTGDGIPDLIVGETPPGQVEILKGAGDGTFSLLPNPIAFPTGASSLVVADFNNDGYQDLAVASNGGNSITILLYEADGGFVSSSMNDIFKKPIALLVADLQQPGSHDLIVGAANSALVPEVVTLINQGGSFTLGSTATLVDGVVALTPGDFNGQSNEVDVAALGAHGVTIVAITGAGTTITPGVPVPLTTSNVVAGASGNLDGHPNGVSDLAVADAQNNQVIPLLNGSSGLAAQAALAVNAPTAAAVADLNGDGKPDVAAAGTSVGGTSDVLVFINQTVGSASSLTFFTPVGAYVVGAQPVALAVGDLNGDGRPDLVTASGGNDNLSVLLGQCP